jgi:hypothetical protein
MKMQPILKKYIKARQRRDIRMKFGGLTCIRFWHSENLLSKVWTSKAGGCGS